TPVTGSIVATDAGLMLQVTDAGWCAWPLASTSCTVRAGRLSPTKVESRIGLTTSSSGPELAVVWQASAAAAAAAAPNAVRVRFIAPKCTGLAAAGARAARSRRGTFPRSPARTSTSPETTGDYR